MPSRITHQSATATQAAPLSPTLAPSLSPPQAALLSPTQAAPVIEALPHS